jgi:hypothetical protein
MSVNRALIYFDATSLFSLHPWCPRSVNDAIVFQLVEILQEVQLLFAFVSVEYGKLYKLPSSQRVHHWDHEPSMIEIKIALLKISSTRRRYI